MNVLRKQRYFVKASRNASEGLDIKPTNEEKRGKWDYVENIAIYQAALLKVLQKCGFLTNVENKARLDF